MKEDLIRAFRKEFGQDPEHVFFCPGRVNLIGEHIDYNGGLVMPCAISMGTWLAVKKNASNTFSFHAIDFAESAELPVQSSYTKSGSSWFNYPLGVINEFLIEGKEVRGLDFYFAGNLPVGAGLSSSASVEVVTAFAMNFIFGWKQNRTELSLLSQRAENNFVGVQCGIMDQFAVANGKKDQAIQLNCETLDYSFIPFRIAGTSLLVINSNKKRQLAESKYNERYSECMRSLSIIQEKKDIKNLCELTQHEFEELSSDLQDPVLIKRCRHVVTEQARVLAAGKALLEHDLKKFGQLMFESHQSLRDNYEVSGKELDTIVEFALNKPECIGARMTGAGFGGCAIALVQTSAVENFISELQTFYTKKIGYPLTVYQSEIGDGVHELMI